MIWVNGRSQGNTFGRGGDEEEALATARRMAEQEAEKFVGDWQITIQSIGYYVGSRVAASHAAATTAPKASPEAVPWRKAGRRARTEAKRKGVVVA